MGDWPRDERCGCPILSHDLECTQKMLRENPRKWGEGLRGQIEILTQERDRYKSALEEIKDGLSDCTCDDPEGLGHESVMCQLYFVAEAALSDTIAERTADKDE